VFARPSRASKQLPPLSGRGGALKVTAATQRRAVQCTNDAHYCVSTCGLGDIHLCGTPVGVEWELERHAGAAVPHLSWQRLLGAELP
jgi:hypothetical protein